MADIPNLKINQRANLERSNLYKIKFISKVYMKIGQIANGAEYRMDEQFQNFIILGTLIISQNSNLNSENI